MAKDKTNKAQYRAILKEMGLDLDEAKILAFSFVNPETFHFALMDSGIPYHLFDCLTLENGKRIAQIVISKEVEADLIPFAEKEGGERSTLVLT